MKRKPFLVKIGEEDKIFFERELPNFEWKQRIRIIRRDYVEYKQARTQIDQFGTKLYGQLFWPKIKDGIQKKYTRKKR